MPPCRAASCRSVLYLHPIRAGRGKAITASHPVLWGRARQLQHNPPKQGASDFSGVGDPRAS